MSYVIRMPNAIPGGQCWYNGSDGDPGRTLRLVNAAEFLSKALVEKKIAELRRKYPDRMFVIEPSPLEGVIEKE